jgi:hypothetical protein
MIKAFFTLFLFCSPFLLFSQDTNVIVEQSGTTAERFPVFECLNLQSKGLENVLQPGSRLYFFKFSSSRIFKQNNFNGNIKVLLR